MPDPAQLLPYRIWAWCIELAIHEEPAGPLQLTMVSPRWSVYLLDSPLLWSKIYFQNEEDEAARVWTFLHLSGDCMLDVDITTVLPSSDSLHGLLRPHLSRIRTITFRPYVPHPITILHRQQWQRAVAYILSTFSDKIKPTDIEHIICVGMQHHIDVMQFRVAHVVARTDLLEEQNSVAAESVQEQGHFLAWYETMSGIIDGIEEIAGRFRSATNSGGDRDAGISDQTRASGKWVLQVPDPQPEHLRGGNLLQLEREDLPGIIGPSEEDSVRPLHLRRDPFLLTNAIFQGVSLPNKGWGYRAVAPIRGNELILREPPLFSPGTEQLHNDAAAAIQEMNQWDRQHYSQLSIAPIFEDLEDDLGRFKTNALKMRQASGVFLFGSRFNHSCQPNVDHYWDGEEMQFRALRNISAGEELCISYDVKGMFLQKGHRQARLRVFGIDQCICSACLWGTVESDRRRERAGEIIREPPKPDISDPKSIHQAYLTICGALGDLQKEQLYYFRDTLFYDGYQLCQRAYDHENSRRWLSWAYSEALAKVGEHDERVKYMHQRLKELRYLNSRSGSPVGTPPVLSVYPAKITWVHCKATYHSNAIQRPTSLREWLSRVPRSLSLPQHTGSRMLYSFLKHIMELRPLLWFIVLCSAALMGATARRV